MNYDAITKLYMTQGSIIYKYLIKLGCSKQEAEDILQESFTRAMEHMDGVRVEKLRSWLFTVSINIFRTFKKRNNRLSFSLDEALDNYKRFLNNLQFDFKNSDYKNEFSSIYSTLKAKDQLEGDNVDIIGVVVYGSPEELQKLSTNPHIKASSVGVITKDIIFN
ncbi:sigma-70 family RNA polymerase sigma factor [Clostridium putrefaciens]|uniref:Sigma-70 family RNA polymerase sigma factor n=1 Tax=Clostridium putrefaciens TaxID=99675 RepID=A0A381J674_9CLOT|nr:anti sigma factor C-terminal domain-containing protein [Clostridium putrefaciens]SUY45324.1 sigma-70 family RNA polymerase sigma factor [Clostridium putrefaciens]